MVLGAAHLYLLCCHPPQIPISDLKNNLNENNGFNNFSFNDFNKKNCTNGNFVNSQDSTYFKNTEKNYSNLNNDYYNDKGILSIINQQINNPNLSIQEMINQHNNYLNNIKQNELNDNSLYK